MNVSIEQQPEHEQAFVALDDPMEVVDEANFVFEAPEVELLEEIITVDVLPKAMGEQVFNLYIKNCRLPFGVQRPRLSLKYNHYKQQFINNS